MRSIVVGFLVFVLLYHIVVTYVSFGVGIIPPYGILLMRDILWFLIIIIFIIYSLTYTKKYFNQRYALWGLFLLLLISSIGTSILFGVDVKHMAVGIKYSLYYIVPFLTALYIGGVWSHSLSEHDIKKRIFLIWKIIIGVLVVGRLWQILKNIFPDMLMQFGYGPLGDYIYGKNPPLYYLTGPKGFQRWSGLFSGPNNYGYFLVAFFGLYRYGIRAYISSMGGKIALWSLYIVTLLATLSRGAILGVLIQVVMISYVLYYAKRKMILLAVIAGVVSVGGLSLMKRESTIAHIKAKVTSLSYVQQSPLGYGLGSSGPSIHSQGGFLPENYFVQLMMDLGIHGFVLWGVFRVMVFLIIRRLYEQRPSSRTLLFFVSIGFVGLMIEGLFLHVLEDSMVNYTYFIVWGIIVGYVANEHRLFKSSHS